MRILLINLARMGDLIQTTPATQGLANTGAEVTLLVPGSFVEFAKGLPGVHEVIGFEQEALSRGTIGYGSSYVFGFRTWRNLLERIRSRRFDKAVNLTHDQVSSRLIALSGASELCGRVELPNSAVMVRGPWSRYFYSVLVRRSMNPFNLADIYRYASGVTEGKIPVRYSPSAAAHDEAEQLLKEIEDPFVVVHPGANHPHRQWPSHHYREVIQNLNAEGYRVVITGGESEVSLTEQIARDNSNRTVVLAGKTSPQTLAAILQRAALLLSNDTGPVHLAAAVGTRTVSIFLAMARPEDTAPCAEGHLVFETTYETHPCPENSPCPLPKCGFTIPPQAVADFIMARLKGHAAEELRPPLSLDQFRVIKTVWDDRGDLSLQELPGWGSSGTIGRKADRARPWLRAHLTGINEPFEPSDLVNVLSTDELITIKYTLQRSEDLFGLLVGGENRSLGESLRNLEAKFGNLEAGAGDLEGLLIAYRLERESLYQRGRDVLLNEGPARIANWIDWMARANPEQRILSEVPETVAESAR